MRFGSRLFAFALLAGEWGCTAAEGAGDSVAGPESTFPTGREAWRWPFRSDSAWNLPEGTGLALEEDGACTSGVRDPEADAWVNAAEWSHPVFRAAEGDPVVSVTEEGELQTQVATPPDAVPADPQYPEGDAHLHLVDVDGRTVTEMWRARADGDGWAVDSVAVVDLYGSGIGTDGVRIYGGSAIGGLIRTGEVDEGVWHALALSLPLQDLAPEAVWPATTLDSSRTGDMTGAVPVGQLVALPADLDLGFIRTPAGRAIARALRDYGAYVVDHASGFALYAEPPAEAEVAPARDDLDAIRAELRCATNNSELDPGGPGERVQELAPEL